MTKMESEKEITCCVCGTKLNPHEGLKSSSGDVVCGEDCKKAFMDLKTENLTVYSRVTGYCTPVSSWNKGKLREFKDRQKYKLGR